MKIIDIEDIQAAFLKEARRLVNRFEKELEKIKIKPEGKSNSKNIFRLFVSAHTLNGTSGIAGNRELETASSALTENIRSVKDGIHDFRPEYIEDWSSKISFCRSILEKNRAP